MSVCLLDDDSIWYTIEPVTFDELLANNNAFQRHHADTAKANPFDLYCAEA